MAENIFYKLQKARVSVLETGMKKNSKPGLRYKYFELADFLEDVQKACLEQKICPVVRYYADNATLTIYDAESSDSIVFECPNTATAKVPNAQEIQNEGARQTYVRRYLYLAAFEIVESDAIETISATSTVMNGLLEDAEKKATPKKETKAEPKPVADEKTLAEIHRMCDEIEFAKDTEYIDKMLTKKGAKSVDELDLEFVTKVYNHVCGQKEN